MKEYKEYLKKDKRRENKMSKTFMLAKDMHLGMKFPKSASGNPPPGCEGHEEKAENGEWWWSEKYDGYRSQWISEEREFYSRSLNIFHGPEWFKMAMPPKRNIDGELWVGRENFEKMGVVRRKEPGDEDWIPVKFMVYDLPDEKKPFSERVRLLKKLVKENSVRWNINRKKLPEPFNELECPLIFAPQMKIKSEKHMLDVYNKIIQKGGEGIMIKQGSSLYSNGRSPHMLKLKPAFDEEGVIIDYSDGKKDSKYEGLLGGFVVRPLLNMDKYHVLDKDDNHIYTVSGMDDYVRESYLETHPIGTIITITHSGRTESGKPRFARYMRIRDDVVIKDKVEKESTEKIEAILKIFKELADYEKTNGQVYKASSYRKVIDGLKKMNSDIELTEHNIKSIKGVGDSLYKKIVEIKTTGTTPLYEKIKNVTDPRKDFMNIHGVGPKKAKELVEAGFTCIQDLRDLKKKSEVLNKVQISGLQYYEDLLKRIPYEEIQKHERLLKNVLMKVDKNAELTIAGSYRRKCSDSGDIDVLLKSDDKTVYDRFVKKLKKDAYLIEDLAFGRKKYNGISKVGRDGTGRRIDIMYTTPQEYPFAILYFTGSKEFNQMMRKVANDKGFTLNEYNLEKLSDNGDKVIVDPNGEEIKVEKDIFDFLEMGYVEPWQRKL